jgi:hypothetical protein
MGALMGKHRFLYDNLITDESMLAVSSLRAGTVSSALKEGAGAATLNPSGVYTGTVDREYIVEIESIAGGAEVGQATFRWSDGSGAWNATGVTTSAADINLNYGVKVNFTTGSGADFVVGDRWYFKGINLFSVGKMIDRDRDHRYRSAALQSPNTITITLASAQEIKALVFYDHNLSAAATITLKGNSVDVWSSPPFSEAIAWNEGKIVHYLATPTTYKCWQIQITDTGNPDGFIEIADLFLGSYMELSRNYSQGFSVQTDFLKDTNSTPYGIRRHRFYNTQKTFGFDFNVMVAADITAMETLIESICSRADGTFKPFWFNKDSATPDTYLVELESLPVKHLGMTFYDIPLTFTEVLTSV